MPALSALFFAAETTAKKKFWILDPLYTVLGHTLAWFYGFVGDYGLSIVLLTVAVRVLLIPLTIKQIRSMQAMQRLQPEIKRLQQKYKDDRQKLNEETMKFYKENKVNPLSGCLPLLLQMPLFIVLYRLINNLVPKGRSTGKITGPPKHIPKDSELYHSLVREAGTMKAWGMDLAERVTHVHGLGKAWPYYLLIGFVVATGWYQQRQTMARQTRDGGAVNQQMQMMGKIFPIFFGFISLTIPAGVVIYFATSNVWQIAQQAIMFRKPTPMGAGPGKGVGAGGTAKPTKPEEKPPGGTKPAAKPEAKPRSPSGRAQPPGGNGARSAAGHGRRANGGGSTGGVGRGHRSLGGRRQGERARPTRGRCPGGRVRSARGTAWGAVRPAAVGGPGAGAGSPDRAASQTRPPRSSRPPARSRATSGSTYAARPPGRPGAREGDRHE